MKYDKEEKTIIDAYEKGKMKVSTPSKKELASIKAIEMGIPYQTLISGIIHRYIEGELTSEEDNHRLQRIVAKGGHSR